jgi:RNA polymerase sigma-70 factor (ECF subfamily)
MTDYSDTDRALVRRVLSGDDDAFAQFFELMFPRVYRFALARVGEREDAAEDIAQATLCQVVRSLATWRGEASLFTWICTICRHEIDTWRRKHPLDAAVELVEDAPEIRAALESLHTHERLGAHTTIERRELAVLVQRVLDHLPVHYSNALEWKYLDDISVRDIAARLNLSEKAAESLLTRARAAFRDLVRTIAPELDLSTRRRSHGATS